MTYHRTQIALDPEEHRRLVREAAERGLSMAEYLRRVIGARAGESAPAYGRRSFEPIFGIVGGGERRDTSDMDDEAGRAFEEELERSVRRKVRRRPPKGRKS